MGNRLINCCDTPASLRVSEFTLNAPGQIAQADVTPPTTKGFSKLKLEVLNSDALATGQLLFMDQLGLLDSLRSARDGCTYFGSHKKLRGEVVNDFLIPAEGDRGRHFVVYYNFDVGSFWVKPLTTGFGVLVKLEFAVALKDNMLISIGDSFVIVSLHGTYLTLKLFSVTKSGETQ